MSINTSKMSFSEIQEYFINSCKNSGLTKEEVTNWMLNDLQSSINKIYNPCISKQENEF